MANIKKLDLSGKELGHFTVADELLAQDPTAQGINREITELSRLFASQVSGWGIPMYDSKTVPTYPT